MASGDVVALVYAIMPTGSVYATSDIRPGGSSPAEQNFVYDFDDTTQEYIDFLCILLKLVDIDITHKFMMSGATSGNIEIETAIRRYDANEDVDTSHTYSYQSTGAVAVPGTSGNHKETVTSHTTSQVDGLQAGEYFVLRVTRDNTVSNNASGDMEYSGLPTIQEA